MKISHKAFRMDRMYIVMWQVDVIIPIVVGADRTKDIIGVEELNSKQRSYSANECCPY